MKLIFQELKHHILALFVVIISIFGSTFGNLNLPTYMAEIINQGITSRDMTFILKTGAVMLGFTALALVCSILTGYFASKVSIGIGKSLRSKVFRKVESFSRNELNHFSTASLITRTNNDILQIQNFLIMALRVALMAPIMCIGGLILAFGKSPEMSKVLFFSIPLLLIVVVMIGKKALPLSKSMQNKLDRINLVMQEKLTGVRVIRAFGTEAFEQKRFQGANQDLMVTTRRMQRMMSSLMPASMLILNGTAVALVWFGGHNVPYGNIMLGDVIAVIQYVMQIMMSVMMLSMIFVLYPRAAASAERIQEVLNMPLSIQEPALPQAEPEQKGYLTFEDVTFTYPDADEPVLEHISFAAKPGQTTAIIGSTGSGKSALVSLILRFYDAQQGKILVDRLPIKDYTTKQLRKKIGYVPQKALLFSGTVEENIRYGKPDATEAEIKHAAAIAQATEFIEKMPQQYQSEITQGGGNVSGGQRQRLSIARAIVRKPEIYIFDDSFSALDFKTDAALRAALAKETQDATVIIVAQRISTIMNADQIIVLEEGKIMGLGTHEELLKTCETYQEIVYSQLTAEEVGA